MTDAEQIVKDALDKVKLANMRHLHYFSEGIETDTVMKLIEELQDKPSIDLFFSTRGGKTIDMSILIHFFNMHPDLHIYLVDELFSCGIEILLQFKGKIFITKQLELIMAHKYDRLEYTTRDVSYNKETLRDVTKKENLKLRADLSSLGFTEDELKIFDGGGDVWWYPEDIKRLEFLTNVTLL